MRCKKMNKLLKKLDKELDEERINESQSKKLEDTWDKLKRLEKEHDLKVVEIPEWLADKKNLDTIFIGVKETETDSAILFKPTMHINADPLDVLDDSSRIDVRLIDRREKWIPKSELKNMEAF